MSQSKLPTPETMKKVIDCADSRRLMNLMSEQSNGTLEQIAQKAINGDGTPLINLIQTVLASEEGGRLAKRLGTKLK